MDERKIAFNALTAKNALLEADLTAARQQYDDAQNEMKKMDLEKEQLIHRIRRECKQEKEVCDREFLFSRDENTNDHLGINRNSRKITTRFE